MALTPRISVLTPCLNGGRYIADAIESVRLQGYGGIEHIIADGGSTDDTLQVLRRYPDLKVFSRRDGGMYHGLNAALDEARGEIIGILNADDCYAAGALRAAADVLSDPAIMAVTGRAVTFSADGRADRALAHDPARGEDLLFRSTLGNPAMNACFFRASVFARIGAFDARYEIAGDREFMLRLALSGLRYAEADRVLCRYRVHPDSMTFGAASEELGETVLREHARMTSLYLSRPDLSPRARALIKRARTRDTLIGAQYCARRRQVRKLLSHAAAGTRHDPVWPARFAARAMRAMAHKMGSHGRGGQS